MDPTEPRRERWHVGKEVPLAMLGGLLLQTMFGAVWLAKLDWKIDAALLQLSEYKQDRYTKTDAMKDRELLLQIIEAQKARDAEHDRRIGALEETVNRRRSQ